LYVPAIQSLRTFPKMMVPASIAAASLIGTLFGPDG
jgi:hypothetical protein